MEKIKFDRKYIVIKVDDVGEYLDGHNNHKLAQVLDIIYCGRARDGKNPSNTYLVINTDEPYAGEIAEILKRHGHYCQDETATDVIEVKDGPGTSNEKACREALKDALETMEYALKYVEGQALSVEDDLTDSIEIARAALDGSDTDAMSQM